MPDEASTPHPAPPTDALPDLPMGSGGGSTDPLAQAFEAVRETRPIDTAAIDIAADDAGGTALAEEIAAEPPQKP